MSDSISTAGASRSWRRELIIGMLIFTMLTGAHWLVGWYNGRGLRPLALVGFLAWVTTAFALSARRRWIKLQRPELALRAWRFSFLELLVLVTGLTLFIGFTIADHHETARVLREQSAFRSSVETLLGVDGRIDFDVDGSLMISVCDRSFDDVRLAKLAEKIDDWNPNVGVSRVTFGTGMKTGGTPPVWPGVTDQSVDLLLEWDELEWLSVDGTAISVDGRKRLLTLPRLNDFSRGGLEK
jgi:hypothetical protein